MVLIGFWYTVSFQKHPPVVFYKKVILFGMKIREKLYWTEKLLVAWINEKKNM